MNALPADFGLRRGDCACSRCCNRALDHLEEWLIATLIAAATVLIFVAVLHRYGTGALDRSVEMGGRARRARAARRPARRSICWLAALDLSWAQELCIYMFIWMAKFGAAYGVRTGIHVGVDVFVNMLPRGSRKRVILFSLLCGALFTGIVAVFGGAFVVEMLPDRPAVERSRSADVDRLSRRSRSAPG